MLCITALTQCKLWAVERNVFQGILMRTELQRQKDYIELLRRYFYLTTPINTALTVNDKIIPSPRKERTIFLYLTMTIYSPIYGLFWRYTISSEPFLFAL